MSGFGGADYRVPLYAFVFLVTPGIGYNIFLMTRVREQAARRDTRRGALVRLAATDGVITSAGCVVAATFTVLAMLPSATLTEIGVRRRLHQPRSPALPDESPTASIRRLQPPRHPP